MASYDEGARERRWARRPNDDYRGCFARDRDRILYCSAFRRLAGKTQVVAVGELGDFHTRMTHTLKVAQLGRRLGEMLRRKAVDADLTSWEDPYPVPDPELVEAACLAHDLGHPPFGHAGEAALMRVVDDVALELQCAGQSPTLQDEQAARGRGGFEGNAQTFRILAYLSARQPRHSRGLDLTRATLGATIKYPWSRGTEGKSASKWNAYPQDLDTAHWVRNGQPWGPDARPSFEAQVMDWCDDVTYACHDVEDFYRAGVIPLEALFRFPPRRPRARTEEDEPEEARAFFDFVEGKWRERFDRERALYEWRRIGQLMLIDAPFDSTRASKVAIHRATSELITYFLSAVDWPRGHTPYLYAADLDVPPEARLRCDLLQELIWYYVIGKPALASQQYGQARIVTELVRVYALGGDERLLPIDRREELDEHGDLLRAVTDHVASLTEPTAMALYQRLMGVDPGLYTDPIWSP